MNLITFEVTADCNAAYYCYQQTDKIYGRCPYQWATRETPRDRIRTNKTYAK